MIQAKCYKRSDQYIKSLQHDLEVGKMYEVESINFNNGTVDVYLKNHSKKYNAIFFEFFENGIPLNIYTNKRFNNNLK